jgi:hypothetical protein
MRCTVLLLGGAMRRLRPTRRAPLRRRLSRSKRRSQFGEVKGRIGHFAIDFGRQRLFVVELGNGSVGVVDLKQRNFTELRV